MKTENLLIFSDEERNKLKRCAIICVIGGIIMSVVLVMTQRVIERETVSHSAIEKKIKIIETKNVEQARRIETQNTMMINLSSKLESTTRRADSTTRNRNEITVKTTYDPLTGKLLERLESKIGEIENTMSDLRVNAKSTTDLNAASTASATTTETALEHATTSTDISITASASITARETIKRGNVSKAHENRFSVNLTWFDAKVEPGVGYSVGVFDFFNVFNLSAAMFAGKDFIGLGAGIDAFQLPRIIVGYGCGYRAPRDCAFAPSVGLRFDF